MPIRNHEREAVENRLPQVQEELGYGKQSGDQRALLIRERVALMVARWELMARRHQVLAD